MKFQNTCQYFKQKLFTLYFDIYAIMFLTEANAFCTPFDGTHIEDTRSIWTQPLSLAFGKIFSNLDPKSDKTTCFRN